MMNELLGIIVGYVLMLFILHILKDAYVDSDVGAVRNIKKLERLRMIPVKTLKEQKMYNELVNNGGKITFGVGKIFLLAILFLLLLYLISISEPLWRAILVSFLYSLLVSVLTTNRKSMNRTFLVYTTFVSFLFVSFILLIYKYTSFKLNFFILLIIFIIIYHLLKKYGGLRI